MPNDQFELYSPGGRLESDKWKFRRMTIEEVKGLVRGDCVFFADLLRGQYRRCRVRVEPKFWKTRPFDVDVALKFGLFEYSKVEFRGGKQQYGPILIAPIEEEVKEK